MNDSINSMDGGNSLSRAESLAIPQVSFFKCPITNIIPTKIMTLLEVYEEIKSKKYQGSTEMLRAITDKLRARNFKSAHFNSVCMSGTFKKRDDQSIIQHSGLITIDLDHVEALMDLKRALLSDPYFETELLFISPSGDGLKWIVPIDLEVNTHLNWFLAIANYIEKTYQLKTDSSGKNPSRACFLPYDPEIIINPKYIENEQTNI